MLKGSAVAGGVLAATVTGIVFAQTGQAGPYTGFPGGAFAAQTGIGDCSQVPNTTSNDYAIAYDTVSGRWSNQVPVDSSCASF